MWKEAVLSYFRSYPGVCLEGLNKSVESLSEGNLFHDSIRTEHPHNTLLAVYSCDLIWTQRAMTNVWHNLDTNAVITKRDCETKSPPVQ
jgi:hypothetical protein